MSANTGERPCGCVESAVVASIALIAWPTYVLLSGDPSAERLIPAALVYPVIVIAAGVAGKLFGMFRPRSKRAA